MLFQTCRRFILHISLVSPFPGVSFVSTEPLRSCSQNKSLSSCREKFKLFIEWISPSVSPFRFTPNPLWRVRLVVQLPEAVLVPGVSLPAAHPVRPARRCCSAKHRPNRASTGWGNPFPDFQTTWLRQGGRGCIPGTSWEDIQSVCFLWGTATSGLDSVTILSTRTCSLQVSCHTQTGPALWVKTWWLWQHPTL